MTNRVTFDPSRAANADSDGSLFDIAPAANRGEGGKPARRFENPRKHTQIDAFAGLVMPLAARDLHGRDDVVFVDDLVRFQAKLSSRGFAGQEVTIRLKERPAGSGDRVQGERLGREPLPDHPTVEAVGDLPGDPAAVFDLARGGHRYLPLV